MVAIPDQQSPTYVRQDITGTAKLVGLQRNPLDIIAAVKGPAFWEYRKRWESASNFEQEHNYPIDLSFELNFSCNLRCEMCLWSSENTLVGKKDTWFDFDLYKSIIDDGAARGLASVEFNFLNEPLIREDLPRFIAYANQKGMMDLILHSNGMLLSPKMAEGLIDAGLTRINISLDALTEETYQKIRIGGKLERVKENIFKFLEIRKQKNSQLPVLTLSFVRMKTNEHELEGFIEFWKPYTDVFAIQEYANFFVDRENRKEKEFFPAEVKNIDNFRCPQSWQRMVIRHDGSTLPCCSLFGAELVMGNIKTQSVTEIWESQAMKELRHIQADGRFAENPVCRECARSLYPNIHDR